MVTTPEKETLRIDGKDERRIERKDQNGKRT